MSRLAASSGSRGFGVWTAVGFAVPLLASCGSPFSPPSAVEQLDGTTTPFGQVLAPATIPEPWQLTSASDSPSGERSCCFYYEMSAPAGGGGPERNTLRLCIAMKVDQTCHMGDPATNGGGAVPLFERRALTQPSGFPAFVIVYGSGPGPFDEWADLRLVGEADGSRQILLDAERRHRP